MRVGVLFSLLIAGMLVCQGCSTIGASFGGMAKGFQYGIKKDLEQAKEADAWIRENLW